MGRYPTNYLIGRSLILGQLQEHVLEALLVQDHSRHLHLPGIDPSFPGVSPSQGQINYVLLSRTLRLQRG